MHHRCTGHANQIAMARNHVEDHSRHAHTFVSRSADFGASLLSFFNGAIYYHKRCACSLLKTNGTEERHSFTNGSWGVPQDMNTSSERPLGT